MKQAQSNIQASLQKGMVHFQSGRLKQAEQIFREVLSKYPTEINALHLLGLVVFQLGRTLEGEKLLRKAIRKNGKIAKLHFNLGNMLDIQGKIKDALFSYNAALKLNPLDDMTLVSLAVVYGKLGRLEDGITSCRKALKINPKNPNALTNLGHFLWRLGNAPEAIKAMEQALDIQPNHPEALSNLGVVLLSEKKLDRAEEVLRRALAAGSRNPEVLGNLAGVLSSKGKNDEALKLCEDAVESASNSPDAHYNLGNVLQKLDRLQEAIASYNKAISLRPDWMEVYGILGSLYEKTHDFDNANSIVSKALSIDPNDPKMLQTKAVLLRRQGKIKEAIELLESVSSTDDKLNVIINYELGRLFDLDHNSERALHYFSTANKGAYDSREDADEIKEQSLTMINQLNEMVESDDMSSLQSTQTPAGMNDPVFLVGFPRSGTTLLDQILNSHSKLQVMEEQPTLDMVKSMIEDLPQGYPNAMTNLSEEFINEMRQKYFETVDSCIEREPNTILVDKLPLNLLHLPLIRLLFPHAKIILAMRHPCDVVLSNFMQHFSVNIAMANFFTLEDAVYFYSRAMSLCDKYISKLNIDCHVAKYESVVENFADEVGSLLRFLNLEWEKGIENYNTRAKERVIKTPSYQSVVEPIYDRAKYRWERYATQLEPYCNELKPFVERFGYSML